MCLSVYTLLREMLTFALTTSFPEYSDHITDIPLSCITPHRDIDLASTVLLRFSDKHSIPLNQVCNKTLEALTWDCDYIENNQQTVYNNGFLNFILSPTYLRNSLYNLRHTVVRTSNTDSNDSLIQTIFKISDMFCTSLSSLPYQAFQWDLLSSIEELKVIRTLALSTGDSLRTENAVRYFHRRLLSETKEFYHKHPVFSADHELTLIRLLLINAITNRIVTFLQWD